MADLDCDGRLDMLVGRVEGVVDRYEATAPGADTFALLAERYEGIEIIGGVGGGGGGAGVRMPLSPDAGPAAASPASRPTTRHGARRRSELLATSASHSAYARYRRSWTSCSRATSMRRRRDTRLASVRICVAVPVVRANARAPHASGARNDLALAAAPRVNA